MKSFTHGILVTEERNSEHELSNSKDIDFQKLRSDILLSLQRAFSDDKTVREVACDICRIVLRELKDCLGQKEIDACALLGYFDWLSQLKLRGAAGFQPDGTQWKIIRVGEGIIGQVAKERRAISIKNLGHDPRLGEGVEKVLAEMDGNVSLQAYPLLLPSGRLVGVIALSRFDKPAGGIFDSDEFKEMMALLARDIATIYNHAITIAKAWKSNLYTRNERYFGTITKSFHRKAKDAVDAKKFMTHIACSLMKILNRGNTTNPYYTNYLFYEYQDHRGRYYLRSYRKRPHYYISHISLHTRIYKNYIEDGLVKSVESQKRFVTDRGKEPHVIRHIKYKVEEIVEKLDAKWSPCASGSAFILPLVEDERPLGFFVFLSADQRRRYVNNPPFYAGREKRQISLYDLKVFRSLQPLVSNEYYKLRIDEERQRRIDDLESILGAIEEIVLLEDRSEVLDRLAKFTAQSLNCEGCLIYLTNSRKSHLELGAASGFQISSELHEKLRFRIDRSSPAHPSLPTQIFSSQKPIIANSSPTFRNICGNQKQFRLLFSQLKSGGVFSYLGIPIEKLGVIEVFNKAKLTQSAWSFFEERDSLSLQHISDAIATVLQRMAATASQVRNEKLKVTSGLLLDISHELKNPLYSSLIFTRKVKQMLNSQDLADKENGSLKILNLVEMNIEKAQRILKGMQGFQTSLTQPDLSPVNLEKILSFVLETNQAFCEEQHIVVAAEFKAKQPVIGGDATQLNRVFTNLVTNAIDAMPEGGRLVVNLLETEEVVQVEIQDSGRGIPPEIKDRIFEPFVTTKESNKGTGLGLALSQWIIAQHRGKIDFDSKPGSGTKFLVTLPKLSTRSTELIPA